MEFLSSVVVFERDINKEILPIWSYPLLDKDISTVLMEFIPLQQRVEKATFLYLKFGNLWFYCSKLPLPEFHEHVIVLSSQEFDPEKYDIILKVVGTEFITSKFDVVKVQTAFLSLFITGKFQTFKNTEFDSKKAKLSTSLRDVILNIFPAEATALFWAAMLLKKRIVVYSEEITDLLTFIRTLPCLLWVRQSWWQDLRPLVTFDLQAQCRDLNECSGGYIVGTMDANAKNVQKWFDLFIDLPSTSFFVAEHAKEDLRMNKIVRDIAKLINSFQQQTLADSQMIKELATRTNEIIRRLENFIGDDQKFSIEKLKSFKFDNDLEKFLRNLALIETPP